MSADSVSLPTPGFSLEGYSDVSDGVKKRILQGGSGPAVAEGMVTEVLYTGMLADGTVIDSTEHRGNQPFKLDTSSPAILDGTSWQAHACSCSHSGGHASGSYHL